MCLLRMNALGRGPGLFSSSPCPLPRQPLCRGSPQEQQLSPTYDGREVEVDNRTHPWLMESSSPTACPLVRETSAPSPIRDQPPSKGAPMIHHINSGDLGPSGFLV